MTMYKPIFTIQNDKVQLHNTQLTISNEYTYDTNTQYTIIYIYNNKPKVNVISHVCIYVWVSDSVQSQFDASISSTFYKVCNFFFKCHLCVCVYVCMHRIIFQNN